jgi:hypothetical protein
MIPRMLQNGLLNCSHIICTKSVIIIIPADSQTVTPVIIHRLIGKKDVGGISKRAGDHATKEVERSFLYFSVFYGCALHLWHKKKKSSV